MRAIRRFTVRPVLPDTLHGLSELAGNLWWSWHPEVVNLFRDLDPVRWRQIDHNPIALLAEMNAEQVAERASEMVLYTRINQAYRRLKDYLNNTRTTWGAREAGVLGAMPVAFSWTSI